MAMKTGEPSWRWRRIVIFAVTAFCLWQINGLVDALDSELNRLIAYGLLVLGSPDPTRYAAQMGTEFLSRIGEVASASLSRLLA